MLLVNRLTNRLVNRHVNRLVICATMPPFPAKDFLRLFSQCRSTMPSHPLPYAPTTTDFRLLHIDEALLVVSKPSGLLSVPGRGADKADCLIARVHRQHPEALIVHRLDCDTSGLLVLARSKEMHRQLSILFQDRQVTKRYVAVVDGKPTVEAGEIDLPLLVDWPNRPLHKVDTVGGKPSLTRYRVIGYDAQIDAARVELFPQTGRTHQLRVHMQAIGHPILGDSLYAHATARAKAARLLLHAEALQFRHPTTGNTLEFFDAPAF